MKTVNQLLGVIFGVLVGMSLLAVTASKVNGFDVYEREKVSQAHDLYALRAKASMMGLDEIMNPGTYSYAELEGINMDVANGCFRLTGSYSDRICKLALRNWIGY